MSLTLVFNAGSSSLKYQVFKDEETILRGLIEVGSGNMTFHHESLELAVKELEENNIQVSEIEFVGHRVVHGGTKFRDSVVISFDVFRELHELSHLAPLHNPSALDVIKGCFVYFENIPQIAVFDTAFHQTLDEVRYTYPIQRKVSEEFGIRKFGFHGTSHKYVAEVAAEELGIAFDQFNAITCHLGAGSSITAIQNGKSVDTSMGFTPLAGLMMATRSGDIDPGVVLFLLKHGYDIDSIEDLLNFESGLLGIAGTGDMREIEQDVTSNGRDKLARDMYIDRVIHYIGAYLAKVPYINAIVFTGGIGENDEKLRLQIMKRLQHLGVGTSIPLLVVATNEELAIARECRKVGKS